ncbi:hypothetical protein C4569_04010 [Candidatus Parcubacteria bacterium]|nr:MAG: hypothetical protein C4569_04010 [Candidatus Parcubacteria bacterium]
MENIDKIDKNKEKTRKAYWLKHLTSQNSNWIDGDREVKNLKTADLVNHKLQIAIELKIGESKDYFLTRFSSNRVVPWLESADEKFINYKGYKTILLIESDCTVGQFQAAVSIIYQFKNKSVFVKNKRRARKSYSNIGFIILWPYLKSIAENYGYGWMHDEAEAIRRLDYHQIKSLLGIDIRHHLESANLL